MRETKLYRLYIPCEQSESGWHFIFEHPDREYTDEEFKQLTVSLMQKLYDQNDGEVGFGDMFDEFIAAGFTEPDRINLSWSDAMDALLMQKE